MSVEQGCPDRAQVERRGTVTRTQSTFSVPVDTLLSADSPRLDGEDTEHVRILAESDDPLPPIVVHRPTMRVIDGMHRLRVALLQGRSHIEVEFYDGDEEDVFILAVQANVRHGLPLSLTDRTAAAARIVDSHPQWSDRAIALIAGLSGKTVAAIRRRSTEEDPRSNTRIGRDGRERPLNGATGRRLASELLRERPDASVREIARAARIAPSTVCDVRKRMQSGEDPVPSRQRGGHRERDQPQVAGEDVSIAYCEREDMLRKLQKDPTLRFSETGRALLRLLRTQSFPLANVDIAEYVPSYCAQTVAELARDLGQSWHKLAQRLESRGCAQV
ncbi:ParB-like chromosome segregation protein Spo0J [Actinopolyspora lacussalsi]|nr:ParB-like chromosome segregation protein Spo0J [Actinopolyspora lacussalsi]